jgi:hypothetical protein
MATIDVGGASSRRELDSPLPLVPFIDFLLCIIAFLLVTAVWSQMARLDADAKVPGKDVAVADPPSPELHVDLRERDRFVLEWRQGGLVLSKDELARHEGAARSDDQGGPGQVRFPELARHVHQLWTRDGVHRAADDRARDRAVLHTSNAAAFEEIVAAMDAIAMTRRPAGGGTEPAFNIVFAMN